MKNVYITRLSTKSSTCWGISYIRAIDLPDSYFIPSDRIPSNFQNSDERKRGKVDKVLIAILWKWRSMKRSSRHINTDSLVFCDDTTYKRGKTIFKISLMSCCHYDYMEGFYGSFQLIANRYILDSSSAYGKVT